VKARSGGLPFIDCPADLTEVVLAVADLGILAAMPGMFETRKAKPQAA